VIVAKLLWMRRIADKSDGSGINTRVKIINPGRINRMMTLSNATCTAFLNFQRLAAGTYPEVAQVLSTLDLTAGGLLVFDDATCALVDYPWPDDFPRSQAVASAKPEEATAAAAPAVGRPRLGVVAREVTLLPRHWEWLALQRGGASAALRRLVDEARRTHAQQDAARLAKERCYRFMSAIAGSLPGFEEAARALFADDAEALALHTTTWPADVQAHLAWLNRDSLVDSGAEDEEEPSA
jgi:uncharacterized protein